MTGHAAEPAAPEPGTPATLSPAHRPGGIVPGVVGIAVTAPLVGLFAYSVIVVHAS